MMIFPAVTGGAGFLDHAEAVETRHARVRDDELKVARVLRDSRDGRAPIRGDFNMVTGGLQRLRQHIEHESVVVRAENAERLRLDHLSSVSIPCGTMPSQHQQHSRTCWNFPRSIFGEGDISNACCATKAVNENFITTAGESTGPEGAGWREVIAQTG